MSVYKDCRKWTCFARGSEHIKCEGPLVFNTLVACTHSLLLVLQIGLLGLFVTVVARGIAEYMVGRSI